MASTMVVIKHGLRTEPMGCCSLPIGRGILNLAVLRQGVAVLIGNDVQKFNDGHYHATANTNTLAELLVGFSEHDAELAGFEVIDDQPKKYIFAGLRWEVNLRETDVKIFGPKSDPSNPYVIDLLKVESGD